jgi:hypothetical protein
LLRDRCQPPTSQTSSPRLLRRDFPRCVLRGSPSRLDRCGARPSGARLRLAMIPLDRSGVPPEGVLGDASPRLDARSSPRRAKREEAIPFSSTIRRRHDELAARDDSARRFGARLRGFGGMPPPGGSSIIASASGARSGGRRGRTSGRNVVRTCSEFFLRSSVVE